MWEEDTLVAMCQVERRSDTHQLDLDLDLQLEPDLDGLLINLFFSGRLVSDTC